MPDRQPEGLVAPLLAKADIPSSSLREDLLKELEKLPRAKGGVLVMSSALRRLLVSAAEEAKVFKDEYISTEHLLLAILKEESQPSSRLLKKRGLKEENLLAALRELRGSHRVTDQNPEEKFQALQRYAKDLTEMARTGKLDPVIGRDNEVRSVISSLTEEEQPGLIGRRGKKSLSSGRRSSTAMFGFEQESRPETSPLWRAKFGGFEEKLKAVVKKFPSEESSSSSMNTYHHHSGRGRGRSNILGLLGEKSSGHRGDDLANTKVCKRSPQNAVFSGIRGGPTGGTVAILRRLKR